MITHATSDLLKGVPFQRYHPRVQYQYTIMVYHPEDNTNVPSQSTIPVYNPGVPSWVTTPRVQYQCAQVKYYEVLTAMTYYEVL